MIRTARPADLEAIIEIRAEGLINSYLFDPELGRPVEIDIDPRGERTRAWMTESVKGSDTEQMFVAEENGEVIGVVDVELQGDTNGMHSFYVHKDQRGNGVGSELLKSAMQWLAERNDKPVRINLSEFNKRPVPYYERLGFVTQRHNISNPWGQNSQGVQVIFDHTMQAPNAQTVLDNLK